MWQCMHLSIVTLQGTQLNAAGIGSESPPRRQNCLQICTQVHQQSRRFALNCSELQLCKSDRTCAEAGRDYALVVIVPGV